MELQALSTVWPVILCWYFITVLAGWQACVKMKFLFIFKMIQYNLDYMVITITFALPNKKGIVLLNKFISPEASDLKVF